MKSILDDQVRMEIQQRIATLRPDSQRLWGKMNVHQAICHMTDQLRMALGEKSYVDKSNFFTRNVVMQFIQWGMPAPKGKVKTATELAQEYGGTQPVDFEADRKALSEKLELFAKAAKDREHFRGGHPLFGVMKSNKWDALVYTHLDHHLSQFGA